MFLLTSGTEVHPFSCSCRCITRLRLQRKISHWLHGLGYKHCLFTVDGVSALIIYNMFSDTEILVLILSIIYFSQWLCFLYVVLCKLFHDTRSQWTSPMHGTLFIFRTFIYLKLFLELRLDIYWKRRWGNWAGDSCYKDVNFLLVSFSLRSAFKNLNISFIDAFPIFLYFDFIVKSVWSINDANVGFLSPPYFPLLIQAHRTPRYRILQACKTRLGLRSFSWVPLLHQFCSQSLFIFLFKLRHLLGVSWVSWQETGHISTYLESFLEPSRYRFLSFKIKYV